jgi:hypothetical protein
MVLHVDVSQEGLISTEIVSYNTSIFLFLNLKLQLLIESNRVPRFLYSESLSHVLEFLSYMYPCYV